MKMDGSQVIAADRQTVWDALNDPEILQACIPGCDSLKRDENGGFEAVATQKIGPVKATFKGAVSLDNLNPPQSYTLRGEGKGGAAGFAKGGADVSLNEVDGGTELTYAVEAKIGGKLAQVGSRLIDSFARKLADDFFSKFREVVERSKNTA